MGRGDLVCVEAYVCGMALGRARATQEVICSLAERRELWSAGWCEEQDAFGHKV